jgi:hypothetical protein
VIAPSPRVRQSIQKYRGHGTIGSSLASQNGISRVRSQLRHTQDFKMKIMARHLEVRLRVLLDITLKTKASVGNKKEPLLLKVISTKHRSKYEALHHLR